MVGGKSQFVISCSSGISRMLRLAFVVIFEAAAAAKVAEPEAAFDVEAAVEANLRLSRLFAFI